MSEQTTKRCRCCGRMHSTHQYRLEAIGPYCNVCHVNPPDFGIAEPYHGERRTLIPITYGDDVIATVAINTRYEDSDGTIYRVVGRVEGRDARTGKPSNSIRLENVATGKQVLYGPARFVLDGYLKLAPALTPPAR